MATNETADDTKYWNTYVFLGKDRFGKVNNYTDQEINNALNKATRRLNKKNHEIFENC